ncbi:hypothetical protein [Spiroplasma poulsonii]|uniref:hypothetical protein n=1 Tax=Spiroplasma poulsonii TaxID=2138 RepID=UPI001F4CCC35|nr:hypothetical protein [Spiroplasma poulsonii]UNF62148.1 hypothetical protein MNU24_01405 [Spiroplasma poulsonii]
MVIKGIQNHNNVLLPPQRNKEKPTLNKEQKQYNRLVSKVENCVKIFFAILKNLKIITRKYRKSKKKIGFKI